MPENMRCLPRAISMLLRSASLTAKLRLYREYKRDVSRRRLHEVGELIVRQHYVLSGGQFPETPAKHGALHDLLCQRMIDHMLCEPFE
jgi:hypothetical protein